MSTVKENSDQVSKKRLRSDVMVDESFLEELTEKVRQKIKKEYEDKKENELNVGNVFKKIKNMWNSSENGGLDELECNIIEYLGDQLSSHIEKEAMSKSYDEETIWNYRFFVKYPNSLSDEHLKYLSNLKDVRKVSLDSPEKSIMRISLIVTSDESIKMAYNRQDTIETNKKIDKIGDSDITNVADEEINKRIQEAVKLIKYNISIDSSRKIDVQKRTNAVGIPYYIIEASILKEVTADQVMRLTGHRMTQRLQFRAAQREGNLLMTLEILV